MNSWALLNSLHCFLECVPMQLSPTLLCCMSSYPSETLFDHSRPGKTLCLLIGKKNRKSKTNTRMSVRGQFWKYFLQCSYFCHLFRWSPNWDEEGLFNDKGKRHSDYTAGVTYLCYRKEVQESRRDRLWWQKNKFSYLVLLENRLSSKVLRWDKNAVFSTHMASY